MPETRKNNGSAGMKIRSKICGVLAAGCVIGIMLPYRAVAEVSDDDFNALKAAVQQLSDKVQKLEETHEADQKLHEQDQQKIQQLQQQVGETQKTATEAQQKAEAAAQVQPVAPVPSGALATHNVTLVGDAEVQFGKISGQHSAFTLADF